MIRFLKGTISKEDLTIFSEYFIAYGENAHIKKPVDLIETTKEKLNRILNQYN